MKITELRVGAARTINLGNYESLRVEASVTMEIDSGDNVVLARDLMQAELRTLLEDTYLKQLRKRKENVDESLFRVEE